MKQTRVLQLDEDVLCVRYSPNQKFLAAALLDCTVKIFYTDTLKVTNTTRSLDIKLRELMEIHFRHLKNYTPVKSRSQLYNELIRSCDQRKEESDGRILIPFHSLVAFLFLHFARNIVLFGV